MSAQGVLTADAAAVADRAARVPRTGRDRASALEGPVALGVLVLAGARLTVFQGITAGDLVAVALAPVWLASVGRFRSGRLVIGTGFAVVVAGVLLSRVSASDHVVGNGVSVQTVALLAGTIATIGVVLWARTRVGVTAIGLAYGLGLLAGVVLGGHNDVTSANPWKYGWGTATAVVLLSISASGRMALRSAAVLVLLAGLSVAFGSRSYTAAFSLGAVLAVWQGRPLQLGARGSAAWTAATLAGLAAAAYQLGTSLLVGGYLGAAAQARTVAQIDASGSLILGGRPELAATGALMAHHPLGFGVGVKPSSADILVAKQGMASINYAPDNGYVERFMFGTQFELHSVVGDLWARFGVPGLVLLGLVLVVVVRGLSAAVAGRAAHGLVLFAAIWTLWNLLFSPLLSAVPTLVMAVGLLLPARPAVRAGFPGQRAGPRPSPHRPEVV